jgi:hypothetical protein
MQAERIADPVARGGLDAFVGEWSMEAIFPGLSDAGLRGRATFERALGGRLLIQHTEVPHPDAPDSLSLIAYDADSGGYTQHYFDDRGVVRVYSMTFDDGVAWTLLRDRADFSPLDFQQRFLGSFSEDGQLIKGAWEKSTDDGATWEHDFTLIYRRITHTTPRRAVHVAIG